MKSQIFDYDSYRSYLNDYLDSQPNSGRGWGIKIAERLGCHTSFVSQVLSGKVDFSLEQGLKLAGLLGLTDEEREFFLLLISNERASTIDLKKYFQTKIDEIREKRKIVVNRIGKTNQLELEFQMLYYSSWQYSAVHVATSIPKYRKPETLAEFLNVSVDRIHKILVDLERMGLIERYGAEWIRTENQLHLPANSPMIKKLHQNWRMKALDSIDDGNESDLHYSSVIGVGIADAAVIREILLKAVSEIRAVVRESQEEEVYCYTLDLFGV